MCVKNQVEFMVQLVGTNHVNPCSHVVANLVSKQDPKIARVYKMSWENPDFPSPKFSSLEIQLSSLVNWFSSMALWVSSTAFQGSLTAFRLSPLAFCFPWRLSTFRDALLLSAKAFLYSSKAFQFSLTAFYFPRNPRKFIYGGKYTKDCYLSFVIPCHFAPWAS